MDPYLLIPPLPNIPRRTAVNSVVSNASRCYSVRCSGLTPLASGARDSLWLSDMLCTPRRAWIISVTIAIAAMLRKTSGGKIVAMLLMIKLILELRGGFKLNLFSILKKPKRVQIAVLLYSVGILNPFQPSCLSWE